MAPPCGGSSIADLVPVIIPLSAKLTLFAALLLAAYVTSHIYQSASRAAATRLMAKLDEKHLATAHRRVRGMDQAQKEALADELFLTQPNLLAAVLALMLSGNEPTHVDRLLHILLVAHVALTDTGCRLRTITEQEQEAELNRMVAIIKFSEGSGTKMLEESTKQYVARHREPYFFAYVLLELQESGVLDSTLEESKYLVMVALNLVGCIANAEVLAGARS